LGLKPVFDIEERLHKSSSRRKPPDKQAEAIEKVIAQAELLADAWSADERFDRARQEAPAPRSNGVIVLLMGLFVRSLRLL